MLGVTLDITPLHNSCLFPATQDKTRPCISSRFRQADAAPWVTTSSADSLLAFAEFRRVLISAPPDAPAGPSPTCRSDHGALRLAFTPSSTFQEHSEIRVEDGPDRVRLDWVQPVAQPSRHAPLTVLLRCAMNVSVKDLKRMAEEHRLAKVQLTRAIEANSPLTKELQELVATLYATLKSAFSAYLQD